MAASYLFVAARLFLVIVVPKPLLKWLSPRDSTRNGASGCTRPCSLAAVDQCADPRTDSSPPYSIPCSPSICHCREGRDQACGNQWSRNKRPNASFI